MNGTASTRIRGLVLWLCACTMHSELYVSAQTVEEGTRFAPCRFSVGQFQCTVLYDGYIEWKDIGLFFAGASEEQLKEKLAAHGVRGKLDIGCQFLLVNTGTRQVLIDTGFGKVPDEMPFPCRGGYLQSQLEKLHVEPNAIDAVILTHWHIDHVGGCVTPEGIPALQCQLSQ